MTIRIDQNVPIPPKMAKLGPRPSKYPWARLNVGDSFLIPKRIKHASPLAHGVARRHGMKFVTRKLREGTRIWRVA